MISCAHDVADWTGYLSHDEVEALHALARMLPPGALVVNIGAGNGTSALALMEARADLELVTIDIQDDPSPTGCLSGERDTLTQAGVLPSDRYRALCADSQQAAACWSFGPVDLAFIDADHEYESCAGDIRAWLPHVRPGGILAVHDYGNPRPWGGVDRAVDELLTGRLPLCLQAGTLVAFWKESDSE